ncbi:hypothetical protein SUGI_0966190 [Cryptomeria japonica]|uniref:pleiotropic drug resistance protein 1 isoform X2 n=1 Tax=Cryptomeria japonica TaxID=3369 RepID=UPI002414C7BB|nr:pleiotropic drug resistance protein 1 isoform X2 [Cryptomeria japonica]GLJ45897.1 hypothetical protein SUGI_0966190 [Cryptomeria japonica]
MSRSLSSNSFRSAVSVSSSFRRRNDEEEDLIWAAIEKLPTYDRLRTSILQDTYHSHSQQIDVTNLHQHGRQQLIDRLVKVADQDNQVFLRKLRERLDRVGVILPEIEIRFEELNVSASVYMGSRALPTLINWSFNMLEDVLGSLGLCKTKKKTLRILRNVSGIIKPGRMTLLLGPPSSGKTTLLLGLAGKLDTTLQVTGQVTYNGHSMKEFVAQRTCAYISQQDVHMGELSVRQTLDFASRCQGTGSRYDILSELSRREKEHGVKPDPDIDAFMKASAITGQKSNIMTDYVLKILGLDICADTIVGDKMRRGISGGQKKRVTTGEMMVGSAKAFLMDEISNGLDSSTTYQIIQCLCHYVHIMNSTMVISLLQPAPEVFNLFDDVILLSEGNLVYHGPSQSILEFFHSMGFQCPERKDVAGFLQEVTSPKDQQQYWWKTTQEYRYVSVKEFAQAFKRFHEGEKLSQELSIPFDKSQCHPGALTKEKYGLSKGDLFKACFDRQFILMKKNSGVHIFKLFQISMVASLSTSIFFRTRMHHRNVADGSMYIGALFLALVLNMFNGISELAIILDKLPVFYKQRDLMFYPAWAYSIPIWITQIPVSLLESFVWVALTYYGIGYAPSPSRFFRQFLLLAVLHQTGLVLFHFIASVTRTVIIGNTCGVFALFMIFVLGGFIVSKEDIKGWWIWCYWLSPLTYAQNAISVNEFLATRWQTPHENIGVRFLKSRGLFTDSNWYWIGVGALIGFIVVLNLLFTLALQYLNPVGKTQPLVVENEELIDEQGKEMQALSLSGSKQAEIQNTGKISGGSSNLSTSSRREAGKKGMVLPFQPLSLTFHNVNYHVDMPAEMKREGVGEERLQLLRSVSGYFRPGVLTALVGVSGAGKTTLMDVLAGRKTTGHIEGSITISGFPKKQQTFARISGYCEQADIHSPCVTIYESLVYSVWLRLSRDVESETRTMFVEEVLKLIELDNVRDGLVGLPGVNGLSTEQRKRLTIGVELVANPSIIFMDEPTSGLDARAAAVVMRAVRNTVDTGRTVVCTIHQPSIEIFEAFDELILMKRGGEITYAGPLGRHSQTLIDYLEMIEGVPKITEGLNPATWMLDVTSHGMESRFGIDFAELYKRSSLYRQNEIMIEELSKPAGGSKDLHFNSEFAQPFVVQMLACLWKQHWSYWRNPQYNVVRFLFTFTCALLFGTVFWRMGSKIELEQDILNSMGSMFTAVLFLGYSNIISVLPVVDVERTVFYREKASGMYHPFAYALAQVFIEVPYIFVQTVMYGLIVYTMMDFIWSTTKFFWFFFCILFTFIYYTYYGMTTVALTSNASLASIFSTGFLAIWMLFGGFLIPRPRLPVWWRWYYWASPFAWTMYGLVASQFGDVSEELVLADGTKQQVKEFLRTQFGYEHNFLGYVAAALIGFGLLFALTFAFSIKTLNFQNR